MFAKSAKKCSKVSAKAFPRKTDMKFKDIRRHLKPYSITKNRTTTINHAFAACIAPNDSFDEEKIKAAIVSLKQDPEKDLFCVYCGTGAETWDHVHATVSKGEFSGHGNTLGNLLPCCKQCNSKKGNKLWRTYLEGMKLQKEVFNKRLRIISLYLEAYEARNYVPRYLSEYQELQRLKTEVLTIFKKADQLAKVIRDKSLCDSAHTSEQ